MLATLAGGLAPHPAEILDPPLVTHTHTHIHTHVFPILY